MFKNNKFYIVLWTIVLTLVLPWDQEKIVIINLILFCFFLYYMISKTVEDAFLQKKQIIIDILKKSINSKVVFLTKLIEESTVVNNIFNSVMLNLLIKIQHLFNFVTNTRRAFFDSKVVVAKSLNTIFLAECDAQLNIKLLQNLFVVKQLQGAKVAPLSVRTLNLD